MTKIILILCLATSLFAIGDGPAFRLEDILLLLGGLLSIVVLAGVFLFFLYKKKLFKKAFISIGIIIACMFIYKYIATDYKLMRFYYISYCKSNMNIKVTRNFGKFIKAYLEPDILIKFTNIHKETLPCILEDKDYSEYYEMKAKIDLLIYGNFEEAVDDLYEYLFSDYAKHYYVLEKNNRVVYYLLTKDECMLNNLDKYKTTCTKAPLNKEFAQMNLNRIKECIYTETNCSIPIKK